MDLHQTTLWVTENPPWGSQAGFGLPTELACLPRSFSFLWAAGTESRWWSSSVLSVSSPLVVAGSTETRTVSPLLSELVLWARHGCKLHHIKCFCKLPVSVLFQFASKMLWGWLRFQWACANLVPVGDTLYCWVQNWKFIWRVMFWSWGIHHYIKLESCWGFLGT